MRELRISKRDSSEFFFAFYGASSLNDFALPECFLAISFNPEIAHE